LPNSSAVAKVSVVILEKIPEIRRLSPEEKLMLLTELWDELTAQSDEVSLSPEQEDLLDRRWHDYQKDPSQGASWEVVKDRVRRGKA
jgi:putative addiction module component (TIGR02574 family)